MVSTAVDPLAVRTFATTSEPLRLTTEPDQRAGTPAIPRYTVPRSMLTPPFASGAPSITTRSRTPGCDESRAAIDTVSSPAPELDSRIEPCTLLEKGIGIRARPDATAPDDAGAVSAELDDASSALGVPALRAQPGRIGSNIIHTTTPSAIVVLLSTASARRPEGTVRVNPTRTHIAATTATRQPTLTNTAQRARVSLPVPRPCNNANGPARVRGPVHGPPGPVADALPQEARDHEREQEIEPDRTEAEPQGSVGPDERDEHIDDPDRRKRVGDRGDDVHGQKCGREQ